MKILLVDDDEGVLKTLDMIFSLFGLKTDHASCGTEALALVKDHSFDLIILDVSMPGMNGIDVLRRLREKPETFQVPVIMLSGQSEPEVKRQALALGAMEYVTKPFDLFQFRQVLNRTCQITSRTQTTNKDVEGLVG